MKLCFLKTVPSLELKEQLSKNFTLFSFPNLKSLEEQTLDIDLILVRVENTAALKEIPKLRKAYPNVWISLLVNKSKLDAQFHSQLLALESKNDVWFEEDWEASIWFNLERWFQHQKIQLENLKLKKEFKKLSNKTEALVERFEHNLGVVENIQRSLLVKSKSSLSGVNLSAKYIPALGKGGDYYDIYEYADNRRMGILLADASTHSMAAALLSVLFKMKIEDLTSNFSSSRAFVSHICEQLQATKPKALAPMSLFYGILDRSTLSFDFTSAGSINPLIWRAKTVLPYHAIKSPPMGTCNDFPYRGVKLDLCPGDMLILHTDGLDAPLKQKGKNAEEQLVNLLKSSDKPDPVSLRNDFLGLVDSYRSKKHLKDDLTFLNLSIDDRVMYLAR